LSTCIVEGSCQVNCRVPHSWTVRESCPELLKDTWHAEYILRKYTLTEAFHTTCYTNVAILQCPESGVCLSEGDSDSGPEPPDSGDSDSTPLIDSVVQAGYGRDHCLMFLAVSLQLVGGCIGVQH